MAYRTAKPILIEDFHIPSEVFETIVAAYLQPIELTFNVQPEEGDDYETTDIKEFYSVSVISQFETNIDQNEICCRCRKYIWIGYESLDWGNIFCLGCVDDDEDLHDYNFWVKSDTEIGEFRRDFFKWHKPATK